jgi:phosphate uptake regulator
MSTLDDEIKKLFANASAAIDKTPENSTQIVAITIATAAAAQLSLAAGALERIADRLDSWNTKPDGADGDYLGIVNREDL